METTDQIFSIPAKTEAEKYDAPTKVETDEDDFTVVFNNDENYNLLLWQVFAGPPPSLLKKGELVVYFPQGHLEYAALFSSSPAPDAPAPTCNLQPEIICRVVDFQILVSKKNDEVYTKITLLPVPEVVGENSEGIELEELVVDKKGDGGSPANSNPCSFYKKLRVSARPKFFQIPLLQEKFLPLLDHNRKSTRQQQVVAKDVHGVEWNFWHVKQGPLAQEYFTEKWRQFVRQKNLTRLDTVVFLRGKDGKLRLGIKRAIQSTNGVPDSITRKYNKYPRVLSPVADAISNKSVFHVFYSPRVSHSEFLIHYQKYMKSIREPLCVGVEFRKDDSSEKGYSGIVTGINDLDPYRWPNSKWRCLLVRWNQPSGRNSKKRVSPWEIDFSLSRPPLIPFKRLRTRQPDNSPANSDAAGCSFSESSTTVQIVPCLAPKSPTPLTHFNYEDRILRITPGVTLDYLEIDNFSSLDSLLRSNLAASTVKQLKIRNCSDLDVLLQLMAHISLESLEFNCCSFFTVSLQNIFPSTLKRLKITDCINLELIL